MSSNEDKIPMGPLITGPKTKATSKKWTIYYPLTFSLHGKISNIAWPYWPRYCLANKARSWFENVPWRHHPQFKSTFLSKLIKNKYFTHRYKSFQQATNFRFRWLASKQNVPCVAGALNISMHDIQWKSTLTHSVSLRICLVLLVALSVVMRLITGSFGSCGR